ncbi:hypothetical protein DRQ25_00800 [Candidatus Fermentibacteria bacterium]|nr:MAG: hypothetical protein DRQ25_00800 [Candidatus Fermentibacteria bacterium]
MRNKTVAMLLALFLGAFGVQRFYVGQIGIGVLLCVFFWTGIPSVIAIVDIIRWAGVKQEDFEKKYA